MWEQIRSNRRKSVVMALMMGALFFAVGYLLGELFSPGGGGLAGLAIAFVVWVILALVSYYSGASIFLASNRAKKIEKSDHPVLFNIVEEMTIAAGMAKMPDVYIIDEQAPNAFATGRDPNRSAVAVTAGLLERLDRDELQGVIAHEIGHIKNRDILYMMMIGVMMGAIVLVADIGLRSFFYGGMGRRRTSRDDSGQVWVMLIAIVVMLLASVVAQLIYFAISRKREYLADASGAQFTRYPEGLARALEKIASGHTKMENVSRVTAPSFTVNPLAMKAKGGEKVNLWSTHPPTERRIRILREMGGAGFVDYESAFKKVSGRPVGVIPAGSLRAAEEMAKRAPSARDERSELDRLRETTDVLWRLNQYAFIGCACGTKLKVPPEMFGQTVACPHCGTAHTVEPPAA